MRVSPPSGYESLGAALDQMDAAAQSGAPIGDVNQQYAALIQPFVAARNALGLSHPFIVDATRIITDAVNYVRSGIPVSAPTDDVLCGEIWQQLRPGDVRPGETGADVVARIFRQRYGRDPDEDALDALPEQAHLVVGQSAPGSSTPIAPAPNGNIPYVPWTPSGGDPNVVVDFGDADDEAGSGGGGGGDTIDGGGGGGSDVLGPVAAAGTGAGLGMLLGAGVLLFVLTRKRR